MNFHYFLEDHVDGWEGYLLLPHFPPHLQLRLRLGRLVVDYRLSQSEHGVAGAGSGSGGAILHFHADNCFRLVVGLVACGGRHLGLESRHDGEYAPDVVAHVIAPHIHRYVANRCNLRTPVYRPTIN